MGALGLTLSSGIRDSLCVVVLHVCACSMFIDVLAWHCGLNFSSLAVLSFPSLSPSPVFSFLSTELSGSSVMGA